MSTFELHRGNLPLLISMPHAGIELPADLRPRLSEIAGQLRDTDWHIPRLYEFAGALGASTLWPRYSRYLIDLNRPPDGSSLYPGQAGTGLCPLSQFDGQPLYRDGAEPDAAEIESRRQRYWQPYHRALAVELARLRRNHGYAILFEAHSIASLVPRLFDGRLADLNLGTARGESCDAALRDAAAAVLAAQTDYSQVVDGRFVGGYITRHYGRPGQGVHALQLEIAQCSYMDEAAPPFAYLAQRAAPLQALLRRLLETLLAAAPG